MVVLEIAIISTNVKLSKRTTEKLSYYDNYVNASREAAMDRNIPIVDANKEFKKRLEGLSEEEMHEEMYKDLWHVNYKGHKIYAEEIIREIEALL